MLARLAISETSVLRASGGAVLNEIAGVLSTLPLNHGRRGASHFAIDSCFIPSAQYVARSTGTACYSTFATTYTHFDGPSALISLALVGKAEATSSIESATKYADDCRSRL